MKFICCSYTDINPKEKDFIYLDPPYANTKGMYFGNFDIEKYFEWLGKQNCKYAFSFDGLVNEKDCTYDVNPKLYDKHIYIKSGNSSFRRVIGKSNSSEVHESLYIKGSL